MTMIACKDCDAQISQNAKACPQCGCPVDHGMGAGLKILTVLAALAAAFMAYAFYLSTLPGAKEAQATRDKYDICMKLANGAPYLQASCDNIKANFRAQYGRDP